MLKNMNIDKSVLIGFSKGENNCYKAARNIKKVNTLSTDQLNVLDILNSEYLIMSKESVKMLEEKYKI
jgi:large subunit ribosomal protein L4